jgi:hypothetical protein
MCHTPTGIKLQGSTYLTGERNGPQAPNLDDDNDDDIEILQNDYNVLMFQ